MNTENNLRKTIGLIVWWTEGSKIRKDNRWKNSASYPIEISSADPTIIKTFIEFLRNDVGIIESKLKLQLHLSDDHKEDEVLRMWSWLVKIPADRFHKSIIKSLKKYTPSPFGTCKVRYNSKEVYFKIDQMLQDLLKSLNIVL